jgi:Zn-dependent M28 family amino/carboxypeptidase
MVLELARGVREIGMEPARTLIFALFDAEEAGLVGSCYYVENPAYPIADIAAMFSVDMVGAGDGSGLALYGTTEPTLAGRADLMEAAAAEAGLTSTVERQVPIDLSDHACFYYADAPAIMATTPGDPATYHTTYHTPADTADSLSVADLQAAGDLLWAELVPLAMATEDSYLAKRSRATTTPVATPRSFSREIRATR